MKGNNTLKFVWPEVGKLTVKIRRNESVTLRYTPSLAAIEAGLREACQRPAHDGEREEDTQIPTTGK